MSESDLGKKVFFLYPPSVIRDGMIARLLEQEFEVYMLNDHSSALLLLNHWSDAIIFINIDAGLTEPEWEAWIRQIMENPLTAGVKVGIVSYNSNEELQKKYLMDIGIHCGFVKLKLGADESSKILLATLKAVEAKGRRKFVRANCTSDQMSTVNVREGRINVTGNLNDISVVGFSCTFNPDPFFKKNTLLQDIQLKLRGSLLIVEAIVFGTRTDEKGTTYVMLFTQHLDQISRQKIRGYIQTALQMEIESQEQSLRLSNKTDKPAKPGHEELPAI